MPVYMAYHISCLDIETNYHFYQEINSGLEENFTNKDSKANNIFYVGFTYQYIKMNQYLSKSIMKVTNDWCPE